MPQGIRDSPHLFAEALGKELREIHLKEGAILQYVDDILTCSPSMEALDKNTIEVLNFLGAQGYRVSQTNAQISKQQVKYLNYIINLGSRQLSPDRKQAILGLSTLRTNTFFGHGRILQNLDSMIWDNGLSPCMKPLKAQIQNHYFGLGNRKRLLIISSRPSPEPLLWVSPI